MNDNDKLTAKPSASIETESVTAFSATASAFSAVDEIEPRDPKEYNPEPFSSVSGGHDSVSLNSGALQYTVTDFTLPGRNGFDLSITRRYDSYSANTYDLTPHYQGTQLISSTRPNTHLINAYGLGYGWSFALPSIEASQEEEMSPGGNTIRLIYKNFLHLEDGRSFQIDDNTLTLDDKKYPLQDVVFLQSGGSVTHPVTGGKKSYTHIVAYKDGDKDYFQCVVGTGQSIVSSTLVARQDRFSNTLLFTLSQGGGMTVVDTWGREITLVKSGSTLTWNLPDNKKIVYTTDGKTLSKVSDPENQITTYTYDTRSADSKYIGASYGDPSVAIIPFQMLSRVDYPTGASAAYTYRNSPLRLESGYYGGYRQYYPLECRKDIVGGTDYHKINYAYSLDGNGKYIVRTDVSKINGIQESHYFDERHLKTSENINHNSRNVHMSDYIYGEDSDQTNFRLLRKETSRQYSTIGSGYAEKITEWTYSTDKKADILTIAETYPENTGLNQTTTMTYGSNSLLTGKSYYKESGVLISEKYTLKDGKAVSMATVEQGGTLKQKTGYEYDSTWNLIKENRYYGDMTSMYTTVYSYNTAYKTPKPAKTTAGGIDLDYTYDGFGRVLTQTDGKNKTTFTYDNIGRVVKETYADGTRKALKYEISTTKNYITITDELDFQQRLEYTPLGQVSKVVHIHKEGGETALRSYKYNSWGLLINEYVYSENSNSSLDTLIRSTATYVYGHLDRLTSKKITGSGVSYEETYGYEDAKDKKYFLETKTVVGDTVAPSVATTVKRDQRGNILEQTVGNSVSSFTYDKQGNKLTATDALGNVVKWTYDYAGRILTEERTQDSGKVTAVTVYDALGRKTSFTDFNGNQTTFEYNALGWLLWKKRDFHGKQDSNSGYTYDKAGNVESESVLCNAPGEASVTRVTQYRYDSRNRPTDIIQTDGTKEYRTRNVYDSAGNKTAVYTGMLGDSISGAAKTVYSYTRFGNVKTMTDPSGRTEQYTYDKTGRLTGKIDRNGSATNYSYDALNRLLCKMVTKQIGSRSLTSKQEYAYTLTGRKKSETSTENSVALTIGYKYDNMGRLTEQTDPDGVIKSYGYDQNSNRTSFELRKNNVREINMSYEYDSQNRMKLVKKDGVGIAGYSYDANGNRLTLTYPQSGIETRYVYNRANLVTLLENKKGGVVSSYSYKYYLDGNQSEKTNKDGKKTTYVYDGLGRLIKESNQEWNTIQYQYDRFGNREKMTVTGSEDYVTTYTYDANNWLGVEEKKAGQVTETFRYRYDDNGNQVYREWEKLSPATNKPGRVGFVSDEFHEDVVILETREYNGFSQLASVYRDGERAEYRYRPDGLRHSKTAISRKGVKTTTTHLWDGQNMAAETGENGSVKSRYLRGVNLIAQQIDGNLQYYLFNAHGDVVQRTDAKGTALKNYDYDAFGVEKNPEKLDSNPFRYCGEYFDKETETYYLRNRYYAPRLGRFTREDPARSGLNWYTYCGNNPVTFIDPTGLIGQRSKMETAKASVGLVNQRVYGDVRGAASGNTAELTGLNTLANRASSNGGSMQLSSDASASLINAIASTIAPSNNHTINATENPLTGGDETGYHKKAYTTSYKLLPEPNYPTPGNSRYTILPEPDYPTPGLPRVDKSIKSIAVGVTGSAALGGRVSVGGQLVAGHDVGFTTSIAGGNGTNTLGAGAGITASISNAPSYLDYEGVGLTVGGSIGKVGVDISFGQSRSGDLVYVITGSYGVSLVPGPEVHVEASGTNAHNYNDVMDKALAPFTFNAY